MMLPIAISALTALSWSTSGIIMKGFSTRYKSIFAVLSLSLGNFIVTGTVVLLMGHFSIGAYAVLLSVLSGVVTTAGYLLFYLTLESQQASNTYATIELQVVLLALYGIFVLHEAVSAAKILGMFAVAAGVILVSMELSGGRKLNRLMLPAMAANVLWATGWILMVYPISHASNSIIPVWISFTVTISLIAAITPIYMRGRRVPRQLLGPKGFPVGIAAGLFSGTGNMLYSVLVSIKQLVVGAVMSNSTPAIVAALAYFIYHDRLTRLQLLGMFLVVAGGIAVGLY